MIIPGNILSEKYGIQANIKLGIILAYLGCLLTFIGSIFSLFVNYSFWFLYFGQVISLIGFPFRLISASKFGANWFFPKNRVLIMVIIALTFNSCSGISIRIPLFVFGDYSIEDDALNDYKLGKQLMFELMTFLAVLITGLTVPTMLFFKSKPRHPPSYSASDACVRENYVQAARHLLRNKDFLMLSLSFSLLLGPVILLTVQMEYIVRPFGFTLEEISNLIGVGVVAGILGDLIVGGTAKKLEKYKIVIRYCNAITTIVYSFLIITLWLKLKYFFYVSYFLVCLCSSVMAITFEFSCELSFPVSETSTIAFLGLAGNGLNFLQAIPEFLILDFNSEVASTIALIFMFSLNLSGNFICVLIKEKLRRSKVDNKHDVQQSLIMSESENEN